MKWVYFRYADDAKLKMHICHPSVARQRIEDVATRRLFRPIQIEKQEIAHMDFGGMISKMDRPFEVRLSPDRVFSCWRHQLSLVMGSIEAAVKERFPRGMYYRMASWPHRLLFISRKDRETLLREMKGQVDPAFEEAHDLTMTEVLVEANVRSTGAPEDEIRELLARTQGYRKMASPVEN